MKTVTIYDEDYERIIKFFGNDNNYEGFATKLQYLLDYFEVEK